MSVKQKEYNQFLNDPATAAFQKGIEAFAEESEKKRAEEIKNEVKTTESTEVIEPVESMIDQIKQTVTKQIQDIIKTKTKGQPMFIGLIHETESQLLTHYIFMELIHVHRVKVVKWEHLDKYHTEENSKNIYVLNLNRCRAFENINSMTTFINNGGIVGYVGNLTRQFNYHIHFNIKETKESCNFSLISDTVKLMKHRDMLISNYVSLTTVPVVNKIRNTPMFSKEQTMEMKDWLQMKPKGVIWPDTPDYNEKEEHIKSLGTLMMTGLILKSAASESPQGVALEYNEPERCRMLRERLLEQMIIMLKRIVDSEFKPAFHELIHEWIIDIRYERFDDAMTDICSFIQRVENRELYGDFQHVFTSMKLVTATLQQAYTFDTLSNEDKILLSSHLSRSLQTFILHIHELDRVPVMLESKENEAERIALQRNINTIRTGLQSAKHIDPDVVELLVEWKNMMCHNVDQFYIDRAYYNMKEWLEQETKFLRGVPGDTLAALSYINDSLFHLWDNTDAVPGNIREEREEQLKLIKAAEQEAENKLQKEVEELKMYDQN